MSKIKKKFTIIALLLIIADQITKYFAITFYRELGFYSYSLIDDYLRLTFAKNFGAAFSLSFFKNSTTNNYFFIFVTSIAILVIIKILIKTEKKLEIVSYFLIISGAIGNLIDRINNGFVIDFIDCDFPDIIMERWPVFNFADSYICIAICILIIQSIKVAKNEEKHNSD